MGGLWTLAPGKENFKMAVRIGINGFGRIGRLVFRAAAENKDVQVVAVNDLADAPTLAHMLKYDSVHGRFDGVEVAEGGLKVRGQKVQLFAEKNPEALPWKKNGVDIVVESTGVFTSKEDCMRHLTPENGAKKVLLSAPPKGKIDAVIVLGVNDKELKATDKIVSNASCTTNCLAPMAKVLDDTLGIVKGLMTTVHAYTNDQRVADLIHKDLRRARAAALNIIPTSTGAAKAIGEVIPSLAGKMNGFALRVPVATGSAVDLVCETKQKVDIAKLHEAMKAAAEGPMKGILCFCNEPIVSSDIVHDSRSCIFDSLSTMAMGENMIKLLAWYDNEWGYSNRMVELVARMGAMM